ncbi:MAG: Ig-like domain-containing protein [Longimicrobiales bacterium]
MITSCAFKIRFRAMSFLAFAALLMVNCDKSVTDVPVEAVAVELNQTLLNLRVGETAQLTGVPKSASGQALTGRQVTWSSANSAVAAVSPTGQVTAMGGGSTTVTATSGSATGTAAVNVTVPVASVVVTPTNVSLQVGQTQLLSASARDLAGNTLSGRPFTWSSLNPNVATVDANGLVRAAGTGSTTVSATTEGRSGSVTVTVTPAGFTVSVTNQLIRPVNLTSNGVLFGTVPAQSIASFNLQPTASFSLRWDLVRVTTTAGTPVGEEVNGLFNPITNPSGTITYDIDNEVGTTIYFAPLITNTSSTRLLMAVNFGLTAEVRCNCVVTPGSTRIDIGYYRLFSNTNVRGYRDGSGYTGQFVFWNFGTQFTSVTPGSGAIELPNSLNPSTIEPVVQNVIPVDLPGALFQRAKRGPQDYPVPAVITRK